MLGLAVLGAVVFAIVWWCLIRHPDELHVALKLEVLREGDGRWFAAVPALPGVMAYSLSRDQAVRAAHALALRVLADRLERGEALP